ncbi:hypothetical protein BY458DRAFT_518562 [Sporodiniella umbellata]|nr:hypothetical protein BY458DRAFT_518562 [Sporodiniella umbellata]
MKFVLPVTLFLLCNTLGALAKGGGGGRGGGGGGGGSRGGGNSGSGSSNGGRGSGTGGSSGGSTGGRPISGGTPGSVSNKGGSGSFNSPPPYHYSNTRTTYTNYPGGYGGGYSPASRSGYYGFYNPGLLYFGIVPPFLFLGYNHYYHRYNQNDGYYYAPQLTEQGGNTNNVVINGTAFTSKEDQNYRVSFNISTSNKFPVVDHAFFSSSDPASHSADFAYRLQFTHVVEFTDLNNNGFYDANEPVLSTSSLQDLAWQNMQVSNITVPTNSSQFYLQTGTLANAAYNGTNTTFSVRFIWRSSNLQLNNTAPINMQPNSLEYDVFIDGIQPKGTVALVQLLSTQLENPSVFDVNTTTPLDTALSIKTNATYGISIGNNTEGRLEYQNTVNLTDITGLMFDANSLASAPDPDVWVWGNANRTHRLVLISLPQKNNTFGFSGFGYLDTDVMNALASSGISLRPTYLSILIYLIYIIA